LVERIAVGGVEIDGHLHQRVVAHLRSDPASTPRIEGRSAGVVDRGVVIEGDVDVVTRFTSAGVQARMAKTTTSEGGRPLPGVSGHFGLPQQCAPDPSEALPPAPGQSIPLVDPFQ